MFRPKECYFYYLLFIFIMSFLLFLYSELRHFFLIFLFSSTWVQKSDIPILLIYKYKLRIDRSIHCILDLSLLCPQLSMILKAYLSGKVIKWYEFKWTFIKIRKEADGGKATGAIFIDLSKAFDTISHSVLLEKLSRYGIQDNEVNWFIKGLSIPPKADRSI